MQNNYYFLRQLTPVLGDRLEGFTVVSCFTQNRDELVLEFNDTKSSFFIRASLSPSFCCLSFPDTFSRAGKNSVDLFPAVILKKVKGVRQFENERSFAIVLEDHHSLVFKMHGSRANVILFSGDKAEELFRHHLKADMEINPEALDRKIDWSKGFFMDHQNSLKSEYFTLGKPVWRWLDEKGFENLDAETRWILLQEILGRLNSVEFFICQDGANLSFLLFQHGDIIKTFSDPLRAVTDFYYSFITLQSFTEEKGSALRSLHSILSAGKSFIQKNSEKLKEIENDSHYKSWADLLMANLHIIKTGAEKISVANFYDNDNLIEIPLKKALSPQKNAELYYRKSRNQQIEIQKLRESILRKEKELESATAKVALLEQERNLRGLRQRMEESGIRERKTEKQPALIPYREVEFKGYKIWIGRNAESNDTLTQKFSYKDDLWLHAKDVAGSHVLLKYQSGKTFPRDVIERAASLAAWNSKRKNESLCPVAFTLKKYVRKRKGDPAGAVVVEREEVILVEPAN